MFLRLNWPLLRHNVVIRSGKRSTSALPATPCASIFHLPSSISQLPALPSSLFASDRRDPIFQAQTCTRRDELLVRGMQRILAKFMKDSVVRGCLLQLLYERRSEGS